MPRPPRDQTAGIRHVVCRGNRQQAIFVDDLDRHVLVVLLQHVCRVLGWRVHAWCLMTNHVHLVVEVPGATISTGMQLLCGDYAQGFNRRYGLAGHLFQGRFHAGAIVGEPHLFEAIRYVDLNPDRAGLVPGSEGWLWSSCRAHLNLTAPRPFHDLSVVRSFGATPERAAAAYARYLDAGRETRTFPTRPGLTPAVTLDVSARDTWRGGPSL